MIENSEVYLKVSSLLSAFEASSPGNPLKQTYTEGNMVSTGSNTGVALEAEPVEADALSNSLKRKIIQKIKVVAQPHKGIKQIKKNVKTY